VVHVKRDSGVARAASGTQSQEVTPQEAVRRTAPETALSQESLDLVAVLRAQSSPLFAILDASRDRNVLDILRSCFLMESENSRNLVWFAITNGEVTQMVHSHQMRLI